MTKLLKELLKEKNVSLVKKLLETEEFFKEAFCISGKAEVILKFDPNDFTIDSIVKMTDEKRGIFYVSHLKKNKRSKT